MVLPNPNIILCHERAKYSTVKNSNPNDIIRLLYVRARAYIAHVHMHDVDHRNLVAPYPPSEDANTMYIYIYRENKTCTSESRSSKSVLLYVMK